jgi:hypothetical protein
LVKDQNPREALLNFMETAYRAGALLAKWDLEKMKVPVLDEL